MLKYPCITVSTFLFQTVYLLLCQGICQYLWCTCTCTYIVKSQQNGMKLTLKYILFFKLRIFSIFLGFYQFSFLFFFLFCFRFFLQEIQAGEALISSGDIEQGVTHLANAVVVCGQPTQLLQVCVQIHNIPMFSSTFDLKLIFIISLGFTTDTTITSVHTTH